MANNTTWRPWAELGYNFTQSYVVGTTTLSPSFAEWKVRTGASITDNFRVLAGIENITDQKYLSRFTTTYWPGRRFVAATEYKF